MHTLLIQSWESCRVMASSLQQVSTLRIQWVLCVVDIARELTCTADPLMTWADSSPRESKYILGGAWRTRGCRGLGFFQCVPLPKIVFKWRAQWSLGCTFAWQDNNEWEASPLFHLSGMISWQGLGWCLPGGSWTRSF